MEEHLVGGGAWRETSYDPAKITFPERWAARRKHLGINSDVIRALIITCGYEFFHSIQYLNCKPRRLVVQKLKLEHLLNCFHNKTVNIGIVNFLFGKKFRSYFKTSKECSKSRTAFNLGCDLEEAKRYPKVMEPTEASSSYNPKTDLETKIEQVGL